MIFGNVLMYRVNMLDMIKNIALQMLVIIRIDCSQQNRMESKLFK